MFCNQEVLLNVTYYIKCYSQQRQEETAEDKETTRCAELLEAFLWFREWPSGVSSTPQSARRGPQVKRRRLPPGKGSCHPQSHTNRHLLSTGFCLGPFPLNGSHGGLGGPQLSASWGPVEEGVAGGDSWNLRSACLGTLDKEKAPKIHSSWVGDRKLSRFPGLELGQRRARGHRRGQPVPGGRLPLPVGLMVLSSSSKGTGGELV